jgi:AcrR family transcriptional regulator
MTAVAGDRRRRRHEATRAEILEAAWDLARDHGLAALSLRELAQMVGMRAPSLYNYFPSKDAIYDAMFAQGHEALLDLDLGAMAADPDVDPAEVFRTANHRFLAFCLADPVRYQLLFQRTLPDFEPSPEAYALAVRTLDELRAALAVLGADDDRAVDLWTAVMTGLTDQQISNDPGGDRWVSLLDEAIDMYLAHVQTSTRRSRR